MDNHITISQARHAWSEPEGFTISRPKGISRHTFLHFFNSVELLVNGEVITTAPDACIFYTAETPQWFRSIGPLCHDWMHMSGDICKSLQALHIPENIPFYPERTEFITNIHRDIEFEVLTKPNHYQDYLTAKYQELLILLSRHCGKNPPRPLIRSSTEDRLRRLRTRVLSQLSYQWTVEEMANLVYLSPSRLHTLYKTIFAISPMDDLIHARIDMAKYRLSSTQNSVSSIAVALGYRNLTHFCRQFKQYVGQTPEEFRQSQSG